MAREITASLRRLDPDDPVKYDFALCHIGMLDRCGFREPRGNGGLSAERLVPAAAA